MYTTQEYSFDLNDAHVTNGGESETGAFDVTNNGDGTFTTTLPRTQVNVTFRLLDGIDEKKIFNASEAARKRNRPEQTITNQIRTMVVSVNGDDNPQAVTILSKTCHLWMQDILERVIAM